MLSDATGEWQEIRMKVALKREEQQRALFTVKTRTTIRTNQTATATVSMPNANQPSTNEPERWRAGSLSANAFRTGPERLSAFSTCVRAAKNRSELLNAAVRNEPGRRMTAVRRAMNAEGRNNNHATIR
jgi:hypothetical protein